MATFDFDNFAGFVMDMEELANTPDRIIKDMLNAEADVIVEGQKKTAEAMGVKAPGSGQTIKSIQKSNIKTNRDGKTIHIYPQGSRTRKKTTTRNAEIAFINEFGKRGQPPRPFIATANEKYAEKAVDAAFKVYDEYLRSKNL